MGQGTGSALLFEILNRIQITVPPPCHARICVSEHCREKPSPAFTHDEKGADRQSGSSFDRPLLSGSCIGGNSERGLLPFPSIKAIQRVSHRVDKDADHAIHGGPIGEVSSNK